MAPRASASAMPPATFFLGMARVGWRTSRAPPSMPRAPTGAPAVAARGVDVEGVAHDAGRDPDPGQLTTAPFVHRDVGPGGIVRWRGVPDVLLALPGKVVVVQQCTTVPDHLGHHGRGAFVERQRTEVLHHDELRVVERVADLGRTGRFGRADGQARDQAVDGAFTGHRGDVEAERPQGAGPLHRLDRHPVGAAQAERHDGGDGSGHGPATLPRLGGVPRRPGRAGLGWAGLGWAGTGTGHYRRTGA